MIKVDRIDHETALASLFRLFSHLAAVSEFLSAVTSASVSQLLDPHIVRKTGAHDETDAQPHECQTTLGGIPSKHLSVTANESHTHIVEQLHYLMNFLMHFLMLMK